MMLGKLDMCLKNIVRPLPYIIFKSKVQMKANIKDRSIKVLEENRLDNLGIGKIFLSKAQIQNL